jgi:hypothetical protein
MGAACRIVTQIGLVAGHTIPAGQSEPLHLTAAELAVLPARTFGSSPAATGRAIVLSERSRMRAASCQVMASSGSGTAATVAGAD